MISRYLYLLLVSGLSVISANAWALLKTNITVLNSNSGNAIISVSFPVPVHGDLYVATEINGQLYFFADNGATFTTNIAAYTKNSDFSQDRVVLNIANVGIPPNIYPLYQVVTLAGKTPLDFTNWIGGVNGLSELQLSINLPVPTPTPVSGSCPVQNETNSGEKEQRSNKSNSDKCTPTPTPVDGKSLYNQQCASCHGSNPKQNVNSILDGKNPANIREAIQKNKGNMGILNGLSDASLNAIASYLKNL